jgi:hypothetical protein
MQATIESITTRFGTEAWAVTWGKGITQFAIADSHEEALEIAAKCERPRRYVAPLLYFV